MQLPDFIIKSALFTILMQLPDFIIKSALFTILMQLPDFMILSQNILKADAELFVNHSA